MAETMTITIHRAENMPDAIHGAVMGSSGRYTIILNAADTPGQQFATFLHEMTHIYNKDAETGKNVQEIETRAHGQLLEALELLKQEG